MSLACLFVLLNSSVNSRVFHDNSGLLHHVYFQSPSKSSINNIVQSTLHGK
jgi:hypothetical protein